MPYEDIRESICGCDLIGITCDYVDGHMNILSLLIPPVGSLL